MRGETVARSWNISPMQFLAGWWNVLTGGPPMLSIEVTRECPLSCPGRYAYGEQHLGMAFFCVVASLLGSPANARELKPETVTAFDRYIHTTEERMAEDLRQGHFLVVDNLPDGDRQQTYSRLKQGEFYIEPLRTKEDDKPIPVPGGLIHHWVGVVFIPGTTLSQILAVLQDYDNHKIIHKPDVRDSKLLTRDGNDFKVYLQFYQKSLVTVVVNVNLNIRSAMSGAYTATGESKRRTAGSTFKWSPLA